jgi:hypothetical protein
VSATREQGCAPHWQARFPCKTINTMETARARAIAERLHRGDLEEEPMLRGSAAARAERIPGVM